MPLALAAGRNAVRAVTSLLVELRDVYQITICTINTLQYKNMMCMNAFQHFYNIDGMAKLLETN